MLYNMLTPNIVFSEVKGLYAVMDQDHPDCCLSLPLKVCMYMMASTIYNYTTINSTKHFEELDTNADI